MNVRSVGLLLLSGLLIGSGWLVRLQYSANFNEKLHDAVQRNLADEFIQIEKEAKLLIEDQLSVSSRAWDEARHFFLQVDGNTIVVWNRTTFLPDIGPLASIDSISFIDSPRGASLIKRWAIDDGSSLFCVLMLSDHYPIINNFLSPQWNTTIFPERDIQILGPYESAGHPVFVNGKPVFRILPQNLQAHESTFSFLLLLTGFSLLLYVWWRLQWW